MRNALLEYETTLLKYEPLIYFRKITFGKFRDSLASIFRGNIIWPRYGDEIIFGVIKSLG